MTERQPNDSLAILVIEILVTIWDLVLGIWILYFHPCFLHCCQILFL
jgi:hypothetical protein